MQLTVLTYNTLFAGRDGAVDARAQAQLDLVNEVRCPDVFLMQEARGFEANGSAWLYDMENRLGMRGFLAVAPRTGQNVAIFIRPPLRPLAFEADSAHFHHALAILKVEMPGVKAPITFISTHLCPHSPDVRRREAAYLAAQAEPERLTLLAGDFNSASPHDPEPEDWATLAPHHRARYLADDLRGIDRSVLAYLETAGWVDLGYQMDANQTPTVPTPAYRDAEFATMRCDYMLTSAALARKAKHYEVLKNPITDSASDHYPLFARFDLAD